MNAWIKPILLIIVLAVNVHAYTVITLSTGTTETTEQALLDQIKSQFNASVLVNTLVPNTYQIKLFGLNPNYITPPAVVTLDQVTGKLVAISTNTAELLYGQGMTYERNNDAGAIGYFMSLCDNATNFTLTTIDPLTCKNVLGFMDNWIMIQSSGIAVVPNPLVGF